MQLPPHEQLADMVRNATLDVCSTMLGVEATAQPFQLTGTMSGPQDGVFATVGMAGRCTGSGTLAMNETLARKLAGTFMMSEYESVNGDVLDAIGEMANMVVGNVKTELEGIMGTIGLSIPTVVFGRNFRTKNLSKTAVVTISFMCDGSELLVSLALNETELEESEVTSGFLQPHYVAG
ncbi:MAG: chemotaxis protein CheX [Acidobacteria bacterium]|nr:chemotaxis protein CheX [Acidobacteriota bacterium]